MLSTLGLFKHIISSLFGRFLKCENYFCWQYFGLKAEQTPLIVIQDINGVKFVKVHLEPDQIATWLKEYKVLSLIVVLIEVALALNYNCYGLWSLWPCWSTIIVKYSFCCHKFEAVISFYLMVFLQDGNLTPFRKSEPIPEVNDEPVKIVVADNLKDVVFDSGKNGKVIVDAFFCF